MFLIVVFVFSLCFLSFTITTLVLPRTRVWSKGFFLRWTPQTRHLEEAQEEIRNMVIEWGKLVLG